ncbi:cobaltochelatase subunit CobN [Candidatus Hodgkinia cicadicola]
MEVLFCCGLRSDFEYYLEGFGGALVNRLFKFVLVDGSLGAVEQLVTLSNYCALLVLKAFNKFELKLELVDLVKRFGLRRGFGALVLAETKSFACFNFDSSLLELAQRYYSASLGSSSGVDGLVGIANSIGLVGASSRRWSVPITLAPRCGARSVMIHAHNTNLSSCRKLVASLQDKLLFCRLKPLAVWTKASVLDSLLAYRSVTFEHEPAAVASLTYFCCFGAVRHHKSVVFQLAASSEPLSELIASQFGMSKLEAVYKVCLPEAEGKVFLRTVGFAGVRFNTKCGAYVQVFKAIANRMNFVVKALSQWLDFKLFNPKLVFVFSNYPISDARIGNGVGLDTVATVANVGCLLSCFGFDSAQLVGKLLSGVTNRSNLNRLVRASASARLARKIDSATSQAWGKPELDPFVLNGFSALAVCKLGKGYVVVQPTRGYGLVNPNICHSAFVIPCNYYWLSYAFYKRVCTNGLIVNVGKHGSLEWLPGKACGLSRWCYPEVVSLGLPNLYFYIVNDPGEGMQAKRRTCSVIIDHCVPAMHKLSEADCNVGELKLDYVNFSGKYYCNLLGLQFRSGLHVFCFVETSRLVGNAVLALRWRLNASAARACQRLRGWHRFNSAEFVRCGLLGSSYESYVAWCWSTLSELRKAVVLMVASCFCEVYSVLKAKGVRFVLPGLSSSFSRADREVLPTGRNFYSRDVLNVPTPFAYCVGTIAVSKLVRRFYGRSCSWLRFVGISVWATSNMRTGGDDVAVVLKLVGVKPIWRSSSAEVVGFEVVPLTRIRRFRIDVLVRLSGLFRDAYSCVVDRLHHVLEVLNGLGDGSEGFGLSRSKLFSSGLGCYGTGIQELFDSGLWEGVADLARKYVMHGKHCYNGKFWVSDASGLVASLNRVQVVLHSQDNREHDILDSDDYYQFEGGMNLAVKHFRSKVCSYHIDASEATTRCVKLRKLKYEIDSVLRCKLLNRRWVLSMLEHGFRGAAEIAAHLDYFFCYAVATGQTSDSQFAAVFNMLLADSDVRLALARCNANVVCDIKRKLLEAVRRSVWRPKTNRFRFCLGI